MEDTSPRGVFRIGPIRPPSEADSLLLQITNGCTWNRCKFCQLYRHTQFRAYSVDSILADIDRICSIVEEVKTFHRSGKWDIDGLNEKLGMMDRETGQCFYMVANWCIAGGRKVFLQDGNSIILRGGKLTTVLQYLRRRLPMVERVTTYGRAENLSRFTAEDFVELHEAGLDCIHSGFETGFDKVLRMVNKGVTSAQQIAAGRMIKAAGIELSVYFMPGLGGHALSLDNAQGMTRVVNACQPDFVRIRTAAVKPGTELADDLREGIFTLASEDEKVKEIRYLVEHGDFDGCIVSDHMINLLQDVEGHCQRDRVYMLGLIDAYLQLPQRERKIYQMMRRMVRAVRPADLQTLSHDEYEQYGTLADRMTDEEWNARMNTMISRYI